MRCPRCGQRAISFYRWGHGLNAFRHDCQACGQPLCASRATWLCFACLLALIPVWIVAAEVVSNWLGIHAAGQRRAVLAVLMVPAVIGASFVVWYKGVSRAKPR